VRRVRLNTNLYALPYLKILPEHTPDELAGLEQSILLDGVLDEIHVATSPTHGAVIVDGATRALICERNGLTAPVKDHGCLADSALERMAVDLNAHRRHLKLESYQAFRKVSLARIQQLRAFGRSIRAIARETKTPPATVHRLLSQDETVEDDQENETKNDPPERITGLNGKSYAATRRTGPFEPAPDVSGYEPADLSEQAGASELDKLSRIVSSLRTSLCSFIGLDAPQWPAVATAFKQLGIVVKPGRGPKPATCPALEKLAAELAEVGKVEV
jgi:hypothetical protein